MPRSKSFCLFRLTLVSARDKEGLSPAMRFHGRKTVDLRTQFAYGAPGKALVDVEVRDSKWSDHAFACSYRGPSRDTWPSLRETDERSAKPVVSRLAGAASVGCLRVGLQIW